MNLKKRVEIHVYTSVRFKSRRDTANTRYYRAQYNKNRLFELTTATYLYGCVSRKVCTGKQLFFTLYFLKSKIEHRSIYSLLGKMGLPKKSDFKNIKEPKKKIFTVMNTITLCLLHYKLLLVSQRWAKNEIIKKNIPRPLDVTSHGASTSCCQQARLVNKISAIYTHFLR